MGGEGQRDLRGHCCWLSVTLRGEDPTSSPFRPAVDWGENACEGEWQGDGSANEGVLERGAGRGGGEAVAKSGALCKSLSGKVPLPLGVRRALAKFKNKNQSFLHLGFS